MRLQNMQEIRDKASKIKCIIFDVDGVLTDGSLFLGDDGQEYKAFNSLDGHGLKMLQKTGVEVAIITGRTSEVVRIRMESLGVKRVYQGQLDKRQGYTDLKEATGYSDNEIAYVGDDVVDLPVMTKAGLAIAVQNAHSFTKKHADWVTEASGGKGAGREICEMIMDAQGTLEAELESYLV